MNNLSNTEKKYTTGAYLLLAAVLIAGLFVPLMNNDAAEYALIAMNMAKHNDFINIMRKGQDYLDKSHMLFWLTGFSFKIFGINTVAYKLPSLLFSVIAIYSTTKLGTVLYNKRTGVLAGLVLGFSQAFITANTDVRTDAILTGATVFAIWQFIAFSFDNKYTHIIFGALGLAVSVATKGMLAVMLTGLVVVLHLLCNGRLKEIFKWRWLSAVPLFFLFLSPVLVCYYFQFDSHPEKLVNGAYHQSGIRFLLWSQSFERLAGQRNLANNSDPLFFFHTFLWAFLPFSVVAFYETFRDWVRLLQKKFGKEVRIHFALSGAVLLIMLLMSASKFKLPHYLNILFPLFAIIAAKSIFRVFSKKDELPKWMRILLYFVSAVYLLGTVLICTLAFPLSGFTGIAAAIAALLIFIYLLYSGRFSLKAVYLVLIAAGMANFFLNSHFFPRVMAYQGSNTMAAIVNETALPKDKIVAFVPRSYFAFDFYIQTDVPEPGIDAIKQSAISGQTFFVLTDEIKLPELQHAALPMQILYQVDRFHASKLSMKFLNPSKRAGVLGKLYLLKIN